MSDLMNLICLPATTCLMLFWWGMYYHSQKRYKASCAELAECKARLEELVSVLVGAIN
jgi:hypothetical protein